AERLTAPPAEIGIFETDAPTCPNCGAVAVKDEARGGYRCSNCGAVMSEADAWGSGESLSVPPPIPQVLTTPPRGRLPAERMGTTRRFRIPGADGALKVYVTTGCYADGRLGEVFIKADKVGTFASGLLDQFAIAMSMGLQRGVPLADYTSKMIATKFE